METFGLIRQKEVELESRQIKVVVRDWSLSVAEEVGGFSAKDSDI